MFGVFQRYTQMCALFFLHGGEQDDGLLRVRV